MKKKLLLSSVAALTLFTAYTTGSVHAEDSTVSADVKKDLTQQKAREQARKAAQRARVISEALKPLNQNVLRTYKTYMQAQDAYNTLLARLELAQEEITKINEAIKLAADMKADHTLSEQELDAAKAATQAVQAELTARKNDLTNGRDEVRDAQGNVTVEAVMSVSARKAQVATLKGEVEIAKMAAAEASVELTSLQEGTPANEVKAAKRKLEEKEKAFSEKKAALAVAEKSYEEGKKELKEVKAELREAGVRIAVIDALRLQNPDLYEETYADLHEQLEDAKQELRNVEAELQYTNGARFKLDAAKKAFEQAEEAAKEKYAEFNLTYDLEKLTTALDALSKVDVKTGWVQTEKGWNFLDAEGKAVKGWKQVDNAWYFFDQDGLMKKWWVQDNGKWYYLNGSGVMETGWLLDNGKWYFLEASGAMKASQWFMVGGKWYYVNASGELLVNTTTPDGFKVNANGEWV